MNNIEGHRSAFYVATLLNPVDHRLYDVVHLNGAAHLFDPRPNEEYSDSEYEFPSYGSGYIDRYDEKELYFDGDYGKYYRVHTPAGVAKKKSGLGLLLYSGLSLVAVRDSAEGIYSQKPGPGRSREASTWWKKQVEQDYAEETQEEAEGEGTVTVDIDEGMLGDIQEQASRGYFGEGIEDFEDVRLTGHSPESVEVEVFVSGTHDVQFLPGKKVAQTKLVVSWDSEDSDLDGLLSEEAIYPAPEIISEIDMTHVGDPDLILALWSILKEEEATDAQKKRFWSRVPEDLVKATPELLTEMLETLGQQRLPLVANKGKHSAAWKKQFGNFLDAD